MDEDVVIRLGADTTAFERSLKQLELDADRFGSTLTSALKSAVIDGNSLESVLKSVGRQLAGQALTAGLKPLQGLLSGAASSLFGGLLPFAKGGVPGLASFVGQTVNSPTVFGAGGGLGVMGEAGAEAILPLGRDSSGRLGIAAGGAAPVTVNIAISTPDAASFRKSEGQIAALMARSVARGNRNL